MLAGGGPPPRDVPGGLEDSAAAASMSSGEWGWSAMNCGTVSGSGPAG